MAFLRRFLFVSSILLLSLGAASKESSSEGEWEAFYFKNGITLYKKEKHQNGLIPFRAVGIFKGELREFLMALMDHERKPLWAPKLKKVALHKILKPNEIVFSEYYSTPWPATDRQFLLKGIMSSPAKGRVTLKAENYLYQKYEEENHIVCDVKLLDLALEESGKDETRITFSFYGDMKGWMPFWLINIIQKKWPLRFLEELQNFVRDKRYRETDDYKSLMKLQEFRELI